jgi:hypothetical protein
MKYTPRPAAFMTTAPLVVAWLLVFATASCKIPPLKVPKSLIDCGTQAVRERGIALIAPVNTCLIAQSPAACLLGLVNPALGITTSVLACVTRSAGSELSAAAQVNASDTVSKIGAENARAFIIDQGYQFVQ